MVFTALASSSIFPSCSHVVSVCWDYEWDNAYIHIYSSIACNQGWALCLYLGGRVCILECSQVSAMYRASVVLLKADVAWNECEICFSLWCCPYSTRGMQSILKSRDACSLSLFLLLHVSGCLPCMCSIVRVRECHMMQCIEVSWYLHICHNGTRYAQHSLF